MAKPAVKQLARRQDVTRAALRVIARNGLEATSLRAIAAELGCTLGVITHYFPNKEMLLSLILETVASDIRRAFRSIPIRTLADLKGLLGETLPTDRAKADIWKIWLSFAVAAADSAKLAREHALEYDALTDLVANVLDTLRDFGEVRADIDLVSEAETLICLLDGVGLHGALMPGRLSPHRQRAILNAQIESLGPKELSSHG